MKRRSKTTGQSVSSIRSVAIPTQVADNLNQNYRRFMSETDRGRKGEAGKDLIRSIFGNDAIAEDPIL